jgi:hypothetical protein
MEDLRNKTDEELKNIMQSALPNQNVPSSIYHRAKQELEFRAERKREQQMDLSPTAKAVIRVISNSKTGPSVQGKYRSKFMAIETLEHHFGEKRMPKVQEALEQLIDRDYIEELEDSEGVYRITPFGESYLSEQRSLGGVTYSNINNSNIAHQSQDIDQTINVTDLPEDVQQNIKELRIAASKQDASGMKRAFGYIADKAVDVAIAITVGRLKF